MDASSRQTLSNAFQQLGEWRETRNTKRRIPLYFKWSQFHLSVVHGYVLKLNVAPDSKLLSLANSLNQETSDTVAYDDKAESLLHALQEAVFVVPPQPHQLFERDDFIDRSELVAAFLDMLLRLLHSAPGSAKWIEGRIDRLQKVLGFLLAVLGDESLDSRDLLAEFEAVANKAGTLVHLIIFSNTTVREKRFGPILRHVDRLKAEIDIKREQGSTAEADPSPKKAEAVNSLFIIDSLLDTLDDLLSKEGAVIADVVDQVRMLQQELTRSNSYIKNFALRQSNAYVLRLRGAAYEAEYLLNSFLVGNISCRYFSFGLFHVIRNIMFVSEFQGNENNSEAHDVSEFAKLSLQEKSGSDVEDVVGFGEKELEVLQYLDGVEEDVQIVAICGMPGVGKTTLAKKLFHHPSLEDKFDIRSWAVVSHRYHMKNLLIDILVNLEVDELDMEVLLNKDEEYLKSSVYSYLYDRRYLIVMDDLWSSEVWDDLRRYFPDNGNGSRILFTSRNKDVAPKGSIICELSLMSDENCWVLLGKKVFKDGHIPPNLEMVGRRIARDCRGLPLAVVVIAGILSSTNNQEREWKEVGENLASCILSAEYSMMMQIIELSYDNLADHLKPCFLYFGVFRQSKRVFVAELLKLWIAEGFIRKKEGEKPETVAEEYLMKLIDRSLVTVAGTRADGGIKACVVHDLLHEFCLKKCQQENLQTLVDNNYSINTTHQRLCIRGFVSSPKSPLFGLHVRSIFGCFPESGFLNMILLRVLVLQGVVSHGSLNEIKHLINLRCMAIGYGFSSSKHEELELAFISSLVNLEFLHIKSQFKLVCTPSSMAKMVKLRHIIVNTEARFGEDDENTTSSQQPTNNVEFLYKVTIRDPKDENMLKSSPNLQGLKCKCFPLVSEEIGKLRYPDFGFFSELESLHLEAAGNGNAIIEDISLPPNVKDLTLSRVYLTWGKVSEMGRLRKLQNLKLLFNAFDGGVWETREGEFDQLRSLTLRSVYDLKEWRVETSDHFPRLRRLVLDDCKELVEFPAAMGEIETLMGVEIKGDYKESLKESAREVEEQQRQVGNEELKFNIGKVRGFTSETASSFYSSLLY